MSYLEHGSAKERLNAVVGVGALHVLLGAGLLVGLAANVVPGRVPDPIIVQLQKPKEPVQPELAPVPDPTFEEIRVQSFEPVIDYRDTPTPIITVPPIGDPMDGAANGGNDGQGGQVTPVKPVEPVRLAAAPRGGTVGVGRDDYPEASRRAGEGGRVTIRVAIGTDGYVKGCDVVKTSGHERLDRKTCQVAERRWRFTPATEDGVAVVSQQERSVLWRIEDLN